MLYYRVTEWVKPSPKSGPVDQTVKTEVNISPSNLLQHSRSNTWALRHRQKHLDAMSLRHGKSRDFQCFLLHTDGKATYKSHTRSRPLQSNKSKKDRLSTQSYFSEILQPTINRASAIEENNLRRIAMDFGLLDQLLDIPEELEKALNVPTRTYVREAKAMASAPADVKELPNAYVFEIDMPGLKSSDIQVQLEEGNVLVVSGERKREEKSDKDCKYVRMERRVGKFMRKFRLPDNADVENISAVCQDGVLTVTVTKVPPPEPKKPRTIEIKVA